METLRSCLVLMPFADEFREVYEQVYKPVCDENKLNCWRVDEINAPGSITRDIINGIIDSDLVIADLTTKNANVFYELGIAHSTGNKTIMTSQSTSDIPFDIGNYRVIVYEQSITGAKKLYSQLDSAIKELVKSLEQTNNPVQEVFSQRHISQLSRKKLFLEAVKVNMLKKRTREIIASEKVIYIEDLKRLEMDDLKEKYGIGPAVMSEIAGIVTKLGMVSDPAKLHSQAIKYRFHAEASNWLFT